MTRSVAIVTGASSGIGRAAAVRLARDYDVVALVARSRDKLEEAAKAVGEGGAEAIVIDIDLSTAAAARAVVSTVMEHAGRIDAVINVAGAVPGLDLFSMTDAEWDAGLALKFHGARRLTIAAWEALKAAQGHVVFISGNTAEIPKAGQAAVGTINAAITALAKAFADRGIVDNVQVNSVSPGPVMTARRRGMIEKFAAANGLTVEQGSARMLEKSGIARYGEPEEVADLIAYLATPGARWLTGAQLRIDGGESPAV